MIEVGKKCDGIKNGTNEVTVLHIVPATLYKG